MNGHSRPRRHGSEEQATHGDHDPKGSGLAADGKVASAVLHVGGMYRASEKSVVEMVLSRRPGVIRVEANPVAQTANVTFDTGRTSVAELRRWVEECGLHCAGQSVPEHICDPLLEPDPPHAMHTGHGTIAEPSAAPAEHLGHVGHEASTVAPAAEHAGHEMPMVHARQAMPMEHAGHEMPAEVGLRSPHETMGHGGPAGMSMDAMARDMRNRFLVAALLSIPILLWSPIGRDVLNFEVAAPFGLRDDVWLLLLSLPVVVYSAWIFFDGAIRALRARTLDMMVLVAVAVGAGWLYSLVVTLTG